MIPGRIIHKNFFRRERMSRGLSLDEITSAISAIVMPSSSKSFAQFVQDS